MATRNKGRKIKLLKLLLVIVVVGGLVTALCHTLTQKREIEAQYNQKTDDYNQLSKDYNRLKEDYNKLQNLPDVTVSVEVDGKDVELPVYSTVEAAKRNVTSLKYENFFIDDVRMTVSAHHENFIQEIRSTMYGDITRILFSERNDINDGAYFFENGACALSVESYKGEEVLISVLCNYKKMYTVYCPIEKEKSE